MRTFSSRQQRRRQQVGQHFVLVLRRSLLPRCTEEVLRRPSGRLSWVLCALLGRGIEDRCTSSVARRTIVCPSVSRTYCTSQPSPEYITLRVIST